MYLTFDPTKCSGGGGKILITVMLIYRYWLIMAYQEKLEKCEVYSTKKAHIAFAFALTKVKKGP